MQPGVVQQLLHLATEALVDFEIEFSARLEAGGGIAGYGAVEEQGVVVGHKEGAGRLIVEHIGRNGRFLALAHVGRIAHHDVPGHRLGRHVEHVLLAKVDTGVQRAGIILRHLQGRSTVVDSSDVGILESTRQRDSNAAAACAQVDDVEVARGVLVDDHVDKQLGLGPRDERGLGHLELVAVKPRMAQDVLQRLVLEQPCRDGLDAPCQHIVLLKGATQHHIDRAVVQHVAQHEVDDGVELLRLKGVLEPGTHAGNNLIGSHNAQS